MERAETAGPSELGERYFVLSLAQVHATLALVEVTTEVAAAVERLAELAERSAPPEVRTKGRVT